MNTIIIVSYALAFLGAASRLLPLTKPFWNLFPKLVQAALPSLLAAIPLAIQQLTSVKTPMDLTASLLIIGALFVPGASSPHNHPDGTKKSSVWPPLAGTMLCLAMCFLVAACASLGSSFSWPDAVNCVPTPAGLLGKVETILLAGGDYEAALKKLATSEGPGAVQCAVDKFVKSFGPNTPEQAAARARGRAFLDKTGTKVSQ